MSYPCVDGKKSVQPCDEKRVCPFGGLYAACGIIGTGTRSAYLSAPIANAYNCPGNGHRRVVHTRADSASRSGDHWSFAFIRTTRILGPHSRPENTNRKEMTPNE